MPEKLSDGTIILDKPHQIAFYQLAAIKSALGLEIKGLKMSRGVSAYASAKKIYKLKGNKQSVFDQLQKMVDDQLNIGLTAEQIQRAAKLKKLKELRDELEKENNSSAPYNHISAVILDEIADLEKELAAL